jgi:HK97 family phage major capsid protein
METPELNPAVKAELDRLSRNFAKINELEAEIAKERDGNADLKAQVEKISADNAEAVKAIHQEFTERVDESEAAVKKLIDSIGGVSPSDPLAGFAKFYADSGMDSGTRGRTMRHEFDYKAITNLGNSAGPLLDRQRVPGVFAPGEADTTVLDLVPTINTNQASIQYLRELAVTDNAGYQAAEGDRKPESAFTFAEATAPVRTLAHFVKASRQILDDAQGLEGYVRSRMMYLLRNLVSGEILNGPGTGVRLNGINNQADAFNVGLMTGVAAPQQIDRIRMAIAQVASSEFPATGIVLNHMDWARIELHKDTTNAYILASPQGAIGPRLWGLAVAQDRRQPVGTFTVGNFTPAAIHLWVRSQASILLSTENEDDFVRNLVTILAEMRAALTIYRPSAFVKGTLTA